MEIIYYLEKTKNLDIQQRYCVAVCEISNFRHQSKFKRILVGDTFYRDEEWLFEPYSPSPYKRAVKLETQARMLVGVLLNGSEQ